MKFKPLGERALVKPVESERSTAFGSLLPEAARQGPQTAKVVAVGSFQNGNGVSAGDLVLFASFSGAYTKLDGGDYLILDADDLLGIFEE